MPTSASSRLREFFSIARFGPDSIVMMAGLGGLGLALYTAHYGYLAVATWATLLILVGVESAEVISLEPLRRDDEISSGNLCLVLSRVSKGERGAVRAYDSLGHLAYETWSATSDFVLESGSLCRVREKQSGGLVLLVEPVSRRADGAVEVSAQLSPH